MQDGKEERLKMLCELAANELDSQKLLELVREISELIEEKRKHSVRTAATRQELITFFFRCPRHAR
jgi:hypothetical protein